MIRKKIIKYLILSSCIALGIVWVGTYKDSITSQTAPRSYQEIIESGVLRAVTEYNAVSYHIEDDTIGGFDYELLQHFAESRKLKLEVTPVMSIQKRMKGIQSGEYDLLAAGTAITAQLKDSLLFTHPLLFGKQVLVQRIPQKPEDSLLYVKNQLDLAHKKLHVPQHSPALLRLHHLMEEIADTIYIEEVKDYGPEQLIAMVDGGDIDYTVCDESIAKAALTNFPKLDIHTDIGFTQLYAWGTNKQSVSLRDTLNIWLKKYSQTKKYKKLYHKYYH